MADDRIGPALTAPLASIGLVVDDLTVVPAGRRRVVRVLVDRDLTGLAPDDTRSVVEPLTLDEVAEATRVVGAVLDGEYDGPGATGHGVDLMGSQPYTLEVSSPGLDRPLAGHRAFRRNVGRLVALTLADGTSLTGRVLSVTAGDDARATVEVPATKRTPAGTHEVALADVAAARVQVEFTRPGAVAAPYGEVDEVPVDPDETDETDETEDADDDELDEVEQDEKEDDGGH